ncbi:MAG: hypothetical protein WA294_12850 [Acidobacteriaceae bacterium]
MPLPDLVAIHDTYLTFSRMARERFSGTVGGRLLLQSEFDARGAAVVAAVGIAGAASLSIDADAAVLRQALRTGLCDFVVTHLDESLRILKNELRRRLPVSVCLSADPQRAMPEMIERGFQPDIVSADRGSRDLASDRNPSGNALQTFAARGAVFLPINPAPETGTSVLSWKVAADAARTIPQIAAIAADALDPARDDTPARLHWLKIAPRHLGRSFGSRQCLRMTDNEAAVFAERMHAAIQGVSLIRDGNLA